jgi:hypothetical protein
MTQAAPEHITAQPSTSGIEQILDTMVLLTRLGPLHRAIVAGDDSMGFYLALRRRGFVRVTTPELCRAPKAQHAVGLVAGLSPAGVPDTLLDRLSPYLATHARIALLIGSGNDGLKIRAKLEGLGFRIEAGVRCQQGLVLFADRQDFAQMRQAA